MKPEKGKITEQQIDKEVNEAISKFSSYLMSNSKWLKLIDQIVHNIEEIKRIQFKRVQNNLIGELHLNSTTKFEFDYWRNGFEGQNSLGGWLLFKEIEYLIFPKNISPKKNETQDLEKIRRLINNVGQFSFELTESELKLICYRK